LLLILHLAVWYKTGLWHTGRQTDGRTDELRTDSHTNTTHTALLMTVARSFVDGNAMLCSSGFVDNVFT